MIQLKMWDILCTRHNVDGGSSSKMIIIFCKVTMVLVVCGT